MSRSQSPAPLLFGLLAWSAVAPCLAADPAQDPARARLDEVVRAYRALDAYEDHGEFVLSVKAFDGTQTFKSPVSVAMTRPNKLRVETAQASLVSDGKTVMTLVKSSKTYATELAPKVLTQETVAKGPVGSILLGGPAGRALNIVLNLLLSEDPTRAVLDLSDTISVGPDQDVDGASCPTLRLETPTGAVYRLLIDPSTKLLRAVDVTPDPKMLDGMFPTNSPVRVVGYRWSAGPCATQIPSTAFNVETPKDFARAGEAIKVEAAEKRADEPKFKVQELIGQKAPAVSMTLFDGGKTRTVSPADLAGKVVVIDFWATWCGPCLAELPEVQKLIDAYAKAKKNVVIVALSQDDDPRDPDEVRKLIEQTLDKKKLALVNPPVGQVGLDPSHAVGDAYKVEGYPTVVILDDKGVVRAVHVGFTPDVGKILGGEIDALLEGKPLLKVDDVPKK